MCVMAYIGAEPFIIRAYIFALKGKRGGDGYVKQGISTPLRSNTLPKSIRHMFANLNMIIFKFIMRTYAQV